MKRIDQWDMTPWLGRHAMMIDGDHVIMHQSTKSLVQPLRAWLAVCAQMIKAIYVNEHMVYISVKTADLPASLTRVLARYGLTEAHSHHHALLCGLQWLTWDSRTRYCQGCGGTLEQVGDQCEKHCDDCHRSFFPNLSPAVMVLISKGSQVLLARSPYFSPGIYSALAGFVDLGESALDAVHREVKEEVGLSIGSLAYFGTQSWPFPGSFMIAFTAEYAGGDIVIDADELEDAQWFDVNDLPTLPSSSSIAYRLIQHHMQR